MDSIYDQETFFAEYARMARSQQGLAGAGEWRQFQKLFPDLTGKRVLDLGCGYGWHCKYAAEQGAAEVLGVDLSEKMVREARGRNADEKIEYRCCALELYDYPTERWDCVLSNLALHYIENLNEIYEKVHQTLVPGGVFLINIEHPTFTAGVGQDWLYDEEGRPAYWPVDDYYRPGVRTTSFLGHQVEKYHHTLTQILMGLRHAGFCLDAVEEAEPDPAMLELPGMMDELRRPMMLLVRGVKA